MDQEHLVTQITKALREDDWREVRLILERHPELKALVNEPVAPFNSPAITSVRSREMLDVLLDAGADLNAKSGWWAGGFGLLHCADPDVCAYAIECGAVVDVHAAARLGMIETLRGLLENQPDLVHARGGDGQTPLHFASTIEIAEYLLDRGADIDAIDVDHESTPAQWMTDHRHEIVRFLIARGCKTDILMAAAAGDADLVRRILDDDRETIRTRVSDEYFPMIGGKSGGTIYQWTLGWYVSAQQVARKFGHEDVAALLVERSPADVRLIDACWMHDAATVEALLASNVEFTAADRRHVAHAARENDKEAVRLFLACGLPIDAKGQHQATPLHWAAFHGNGELLRMLLRRDPPLEMRDADFNSTPLGWAIYGSEHGWHRELGDYAGCVEALLEAGAKRPGEIAGTPEVQAVLRRFT